MVNDLMLSPTELETDLDTSVPVRKIRRHEQELLDTLKRAFVACGIEDAVIEFADDLGYKELDQYDHIVQIEYRSETYRIKKQRSRKAKFTFILYQIEQGGNTQDEAPWEEEKYRGSHFYNGFQIAENIITEDAVRDIKEAIRDSMLIYAEEKDEARRCKDCGHQTHHKGACFNIQSDSDCDCKGGTLMCL